MELTARMQANAAVARKTASEGMVLLKNDDHLLPLKDGTKLAVFGIGQVYTIKGGTGSGEVNNLKSVNILEGLEACSALTVDETVAEVYRKWTETHEPAKQGLFARGQEIARKQGLILVDTKYEFGKHNGEILLMDEVHTPDSSRYFYLDTYEQLFNEGKPQRQLSKEFVREWLMENGFQGRAGEQVPEMTDEIVAGITARYVELYENITGETFQKPDTGDLNSRIENNIRLALEKI